MVKTHSYTELNSNTKEAPKMTKGWADCGCRFGFDWGSHGSPDSVCRRTQVSGGGDWGEGSSVAAFWKQDSA